MNSKFVISANAAPGRGGQGLNLQHMLRLAGSCGDVELFARGSVENATSHVFGGSRSAKLLGKIPLVRRRRDWNVLAQDVSFDRKVASSSFEGDVFQGVVGQCALTLKAARRRGLHTVLDVVNTHLDDFADQVAKESVKFKAPSFVHPLMARRVHREYQTADRIRVMSQRSRNAFLKRGFDADRVVAVAPFFDASAFQPARFEHDQFRVIYVGLIDPWKGFHYLVEGFERLVAKDAELTLWGGSGVRAISQYMQRASARDPRIRMRAEEIRKVGYDKVYGQASVLVHPSLSDGFGLVVAEAMLSGLPVIVSDNAGAAELVEDGRNGYIVPPGDSAAITERLDHLYRNPALLRELGQHARKSAERLTFDSSLASYRTLVKGLSR